MMTMLNEVAIVNNPPFAGYIDSVVSYTSELHGGGNASLLVDLSNYMKASTSDASKRHCGGLFLSLLGNTKTLGHHALLQSPKLPFVRTAILKSQLTCTAIKIDGGICQMWQRSHVGKVLGSKRAQDAQLAEKLMSEARLFACRYVGEALACKLVGVFDVRLVTFLAGLGRDTSDKKDWPSMGHIAEDAIATFLA